MSNEKSVYFGELQTWISHQPLFQVGLRSERKEGEGTFQGDRTVRAKVLVKRGFMLGELEQREAGEKGVSDDLGR